MFNRDLIWPNGGLGLNADIQLDPVHEFQFQPGLVGLGPDTFWEFVKEPR